MKRGRNLRPASPRPPDKSRPEPIFEDRWKAKVIQLSRWHWELHITNGMLIVTYGDFGPPTAWGSRAHAIAKAQRLRDRQQRRDDRRKAAEADSYEVP